MENSQLGSGPWNILGEGSLNQKIIGDEDSPDDGRSDQGVGLIPDPPISLRLLFKEHIGDFDSEDGEHMKNDVSHREILAGDHAEDEQSDEQFELVKSLDMDADEIEVPQGEDQAGKNQGISEIQMEPSLENDIEKKNPEQRFFHERDEYRLPQDEQDSRKTDRVGLLEAGDAEKPDDEGISHDEQEDKDMP
jgi:hypothetical protein